MKLAHNITISVFSHEDKGEDPELLKEKLISLVDLDIIDEKIKLDKTITQGFNDKQILIYNLILEKDRHIIHFVSRIKGMLPKSNLENLLEQLESRLDEELSFFLRLDKKAWMNEDKIELTDSGECFHLKISIAAFPKKRGIAKGIVQKMFS